MRLPLALLATCMVLVACDTLSTGNTVAPPPGPYKACTLDGFSCTMLPGKPGTLSVRLQNPGSADYRDVVVSLESDACKASPISLGRLPASAASPADFRCTIAPPAALSGTLSATYRIGREGKPQTATGSFTYR